MMENKTGHQITPVIQNWPLSNLAVNVLGILAPAAFLAIILHYPAEIKDFLFSSRPPDAGNRQLYPPWYYLRYWFGQWFRLRKNTENKVKPLNARDVWIDGSILCTFVNLAVTGACKDPRGHRLKTPEHGQQLVYEYMNILPIFSSKELTQESLTYSQEQKFDRYLEKIHSIVLQQIDRFNNMKFSTDYVARGMGLIVAQQYRKSTFYIYPIPKKQQYICDIEIEINGPCGNKGKIVVPSILHHNLKWQPPTNYHRALYMSSKLNSISPTVQGSSFLRILSNHTVTTNDELDIKIKLTSTRAKITYYPQQIGVYEINLMTRGCHIVGSPFTIPVEVSNNTNNLNDSDNDSDDEIAERYVKRKKKIITRIVDYIDKKMLLQEPINTTTQKIENKIDNAITTTRLCETNLLTPDLLEINTIECVPLIQNAFPEEVNNQINPTLPPKVVVSSLEYTKLSNVIKENNIVNSLVKIFDNPEDIGPPNDPDLVKCHIEKTGRFFKATEHNLQDKLMKIGAISSKYDLSQCKLKTDLTIELENHFEVQKNIIEEYSPGFVWRQKRFWQKRNENNATKINTKSSSPEIDIYSSNNKISNKENSQFLELKGIVETTRKLFENSTTVNKNKTYLSLSLNNVNDLNQENIRILSLQERKDKFLDACQSVDNITEKESQIYCQKANKIVNFKSDFVEVEPIFRQPEACDQKVKCFEYSTKYKQPNKHSLRRKSRFKRAQLFFQNLETSASDVMNILENNITTPIIIDQSSEEEIFKNEDQNNILISSNSESDSTEFTTENSKNHNSVFKTSDRFLVDDLFKDILDDRRFIGVPNKIAMAASLASLSNTFEEEKCGDLLENYQQRNLDYFEKNERNSSSEENIPGFHKEYPHLPNTVRWKPKSRKRAKKRHELIPGKVILKKNNEYD